MAWRTSSSVLSPVNMGARCAAHRGRWPAGAGDAGGTRLEVGGSDGGQFSRMSIDPRKAAGKRLPGARLKEPGGAQAKWATNASAGAPEGLVDGTNARRWRPEPCC